jgi:hypothetical protein
VDAGERPDLAARCSDGSIHVVTCPNGHSGMLAAPLLYHDRSKKQLILALPPGMDQQQAQTVGSQLSDQLRRNLLILPGNQYLDSPQIIPAELLPAAIAGKLEEALAEARAQIEQAHAQIAQNPELANALRVLQENQQLGETIQEWLSADAWESSKSFIKAHRELLSDEAERLIAALLVLSQEDPDANETLTLHADLLHMARQDGIDTAYVEYSERAEELASASEAQLELAARLRELGVKSQADLERAVQEHPELRDLIGRAVIGEDPLRQAIVALVAAGSPEEVRHVVDLHPFLLQEDALDMIRSAIQEGRREGDAEFTRVLEQRYEMLQQLKANG